MTYRRTKEQWQPLLVEERQQGGECLSQRYVSEVPKTEPLYEHWKTVQLCYLGSQKTPLWKPTRQTRPQQLLVIQTPLPSYSSLLRRTVCLLPHVQL